MPRIETNNRLPQQSHHAHLFLDGEQEEKASKPGTAQTSHLLFLYISPFTLSLMVCLYSELLH